MTMAATAAPSRKASKEVRKQQLIEATIRILAQKGYAALTVADVAKAAGLSTGIIIFHFISKDELLASVLRHLAEEYHRNWKRALAEAGAAPEARMAALVLSDFNEEVYTTDKLAAWIAFWGETQGRPTYDQICAGLDAERQAANLSCCEAMIASGRYDIDARTAMQALEALGDGLWLGVASAGSGMTGRVTPQDAQRIMKAALKALFPKHYGKFP